jgi:membrane dipeptidase
MTVARQYTGYRSYEFLEEGTDYPAFQLATEDGRVPSHRIELDQGQQARVERIMDEDIVTSLHDHPHVYPDDMAELIQYVRTGRTRTGYRGLSKSGMTAVFDNLLDGYGCIASSAGWKWEELVVDLGLRLCDFAMQDYVRVAYSLDDITEAHRIGQLAIVLSLEASTAIENELDRIDML